MQVTQRVSPAKHLRVRLLRSRDVIGQFAICYFLLVFHWNRVSTLAIFEIMGPNHDLDLSRSRDVIGHVTNWIAICNFLLVSHCNRTYSISNRFWDIWPQNRACTHNTQTDTYHTFCPTQCIALDRQWVGAQKDKVEYEEVSKRIYQIACRKCDRETGKNQGFKWVSIERKWNQNIYTAKQEISRRTRE